MKRFVPRLPRSQRPVSERANPDGPVTVTGRYRRRPGGWLVLAALFIPLVLALAGLYWGGGTPTRDRADEAVAGQAASPSPQAVVGDPIQVVTAEQRRTVTARVPDEAGKKALLDGVRAASGELRVVDEVEVVSSADAPPVTGIGTILAAGRGITDLGVVVDRATVRLSGQASDQAAGTSTVFAAGQSYPGMRLIDQLRLPGAAAAQAGPLSPECEKVRTDVATELSSRPVQFDVGGSTVSDASRQVLLGIGAKLAGCPFTKIEVAGHTDGTGAAAANTELSTRRAHAVRDVLLEAGVPDRLLTAEGYGSSRPVADDSTPQGQAANRRVEINAS
ncbi:OmpA family protein [Mobilicoccus caccae]|uniref:OmpA-like domain-containing protein n=1 Tax=Mobilicoccus caccae TaxID=1859295 RepID=A0ABQ6IWB1_9MICO|nr:OmpA family protein [Mobilicoccus caccae]GMA41640.1 hypothetical protein GCM10025883_36850 [Mobilicoccus caccae]